MAEQGMTLEISLYLLERTETAGYDEWSKCIVAAQSESSARQIANEAAKAEGFVWTDGFKTNIRKIGVAEDGVHGVVMSSIEE